MGMDSAPLLGEAAETFESMALANVLHPSTQKDRPKPNTAADDGAVANEKRELGKTCPVAAFQLPASYKNHPGGQVALETGRRSECPGLLFLSYHAGADLEGKVALAARLMGIDMPERGKMFNEMQAAIRKVKLAHPGLRSFFTAYCLALTVLLPCICGYWMYSPSLGLSLVAAFVFELYFLNVFHTRHHQGGQLYKSKLLQHITNPMYDFIDATWGYYPYAWRLNHHVKHHVFTNDSETDSDVPSMWPIIRSCHDQPVKWWHKAQTFYFPLLMPFTGVNFPIMNIVEHGGHAFHFSAWISLMFVIPYLLHGWYAVALALVTESAAGASLAYKFAVSHAHDDLRTQPTANEAYANIDEWVTAQIEESVSYGGLWTTLILGGINMQIEHHIAPALDPPLYYYVSKEIKSISGKYGVKYTYESSLRHSICKFHHHLWTMGWP